MTTRAPPAKEKFRELHVVLVSPTIIIPACKSDHNSVQVNREGKLSAMDTKIQAVLKSYFGHIVSVVVLSQISTTLLPAQSIVVSTIEAEQPLLNTISEQDMTMVKIITDNASKIIWVTNADLLSGTRPDFAPVLGLSRALMLEQPSVQFSVFDVDCVSTNLDTTARNVNGIVQQLIDDTDPDFEFAQRNGVLHTLRWEPEEPLNAQFRLKQNDETVDVALEEAGRCELSIEQPGQMDTIHFIKNEYEDTLQADHIEIQVKSVGMNAKVSHTQPSLESKSDCLLAHVRTCMSRELRSILRMPLALASALES